MGKCRQLGICWHLARLDKKRLKVFQENHALDNSWRDPIISLLRNGQQEPVKRKILWGDFVYWHLVDQTEWECFLCFLVLRSEFVRIDRNRAALWKGQPLIPHCSGFLSSGWLGCETEAWAHRMEKYCRFALLTSASKRLPPPIPAPGLEHPHPIPPQNRLFPVSCWGPWVFWDAGSSVTMCDVEGRGWQTPLHMVLSSPNFPNTFLCEHMEPELSRWPWGLASEEKWNASIKDLYTNASSLYCCYRLDMLCKMLKKIIKNVFSTLLENVFLLSGVHIANGHIISISISSPRIFPFILVSLLILRKMFQIVNDARV